MMTFEKANNRIEQIINILEKGDISLEESMQLYEEGAKLLDFCMKELEQAKGKIVNINDKFNKQEYEED